MAKFQESRTFVGTSADGCYAAADAALLEVGFEVWKKRPMAWLLLARRNLPEGPIEANIGCRPGVKALVAVTLSGDAVSKESLKPIAEQIFSAIAVRLG